MATYKRFRFVSKFGETAAMILESDKLDSMSVHSISRIFPYSEAMKMGTLEISAEFPTWDAAFDSELTSENAERRIRVNNL